MIGRYLNWLFFAAVLVGTLLAVPWDLTGALIVAVVCFLFAPSTQ